MKHDLYSLNRFHGGRVFAVARELGVPPEEIHDFSASINPSGPPEGLREHLFEHFDRVIHYPEMGAESLAAALEAHHGLPRGSVLVGNGSTSFIYLLPKALGEGTVRIAGPAFGEYENAALLAGRPVEYVFPESEPPWPFTDEILDRLVAPGARTLWMANPGNPTGQSIPEDLLHELVHQIEGSSRILVLDEAFIEFTRRESWIRTAAVSKNLIVLRSVTKIYALPGLRLGWLVSHPDWVRDLGMRMEPWTVNVLAHEAGFYCMTQDDYVRRSVASIEAEREWMLGKIASDIPSLICHPSEANYLLIRISAPGRDSHEISEAMSRRKILVRDCASFRGVGKDYIRVAVRNHSENELLINALSEVMRAKS